MADLMGLAGFPLALCPMWVFVLDDVVSIMFLKGTGVGEA